MTNAFTQKKVEAEVLEELYNIVVRREQEVHVRYAIIGQSDEQEKDWRTGELLWEDDAHTIPKMKDRWGDIPKTDDELTDEDRSKIAAYRKIMVALEKML